MELHEAGGAVGQSLFFSGDDVPSARFPPFSSVWHHSPAMASSCILFPLWGDIFVATAATMLPLWAADGV